MVVLRMLLRFPQADCNDFPLFRCDEQELIEKSFCLRSSGRISFSKVTGNSFAIVDGSVEGHVTCKHTLLPLSTGRAMPLVHPCFPLENLRGWGFHSAPRNFPLFPPICRTLQGPASPLNVSCVTSGRPAQLSAFALNFAWQIRRCRSVPVHDCRGARRSVICAVDFDGLELRRVVRQEIARLHARWVEGTLPAAAVNDDVPSRRPGLRVWSLDIERITSSSRYSSCPFRTRLGCGSARLLGVWMSRRETSSSYPANKVLTSAQAASEEPYALTSSHLRIQSCAAVSKQKSVVLKQEAMIGRVKMKLTIFRSLTLLIVCAAISGCEKLRKLSIGVGKIQFLRGVPRKTNRADQGQQ